MIIYIEVDTIVVHYYDLISEENNWRRETLGIVTKVLNCDMNPLIPTLFFYKDEFGIK